RVLKRGGDYSRNVLEHAGMVFGKEMRFRSEDTDYTCDHPLLVDRRQQDRTRSRSVATDLGRGLAGDVFAANCLALAHAQSSQGSRQTHRRIGRGRIAYAGVTAEAAAGAHGNRASG